MGHLPLGLEQHLKEYKNSPIEQKSNGQPVSGSLHLRREKDKKKCEAFADCTVCRSEGRHEAKLTSVAIIHSSFSSDITNTDLYLVSAHADISGAFFSDASLWEKREKPR